MKPNPNQQRQRRIAKLITADADPDRKLDTDDTQTINAEIPPYDSDDDQNVEINELK